MRNQSAKKLRMEQEIMKWRKYDHFDVKESEKQCLLKRTRR
jgi:hypothetical protein